VEDGSGADGSGPVARQSSRAWDGVGGRAGAHGCAALVAGTESAAVARSTTKSGGAETQASLAQARFEGGPARGWLGGVRVTSSGGHSAGTVGGVDDCNTPCYRNPNEGH
jgi:hypothetical protein